MSFGEMEDDCEIPIEHEVYSATAQTDAHGNPVAGWLPPTEVLVFGWEPPRSSEPYTPGHDQRAVIEMLLYAPQSMNPKAPDRVRLGGVPFEVVGVAGDPNNNPWFEPGLVTVNLKRVEG